MALLDGKEDIVALTQLSGRSRELVTLLGGRELDAETLPLALQNVMGESWMTRDTDTEAFANLAG